jgi:sortase A
MMRHAGAHVRPASHQVEPVRVVVRTLGELSITLGVLLLLFVTWQLWWTDVEADREQGRLTQALEREWLAEAGVSDVEAAPVPSEPAESTAPPPPPQTPVPELPGEAFAILRVPAFGADYAKPVLAGTSVSVLREGVGHYDGSTAPGEVGNFALAGHRTTYGAPFYSINVLDPGDPLVVQTADGYYTYRVTSSEIVSPAQTEVVAPVPGQPGVAPTEAMITLTSCHPRYSARQRYIVHGVFDSYQPLEAGPPVVLAAGDG